MPAPLQFLAKYLGTPRRVTFGGSSSSGTPFENDSSGAISVPGATTINWVPSPTPNPQPIRERIFMQNTHPPYNDGFILPFTFGQVQTEQLSLEADAYSVRDGARVDQKLQQHTIAMGE